MKDEVDVSDITMVRCACGWVGFRFQRGEEAKVLDDIGVKDINDEDVEMIEKRRCPNCGYEF
ncbi:MAG: hypothetical protein QXP42_00450 [Candidatus Micrarchaeia archaeon]